jgi:hypothetical protein
VYPTASTNYKFKDVRVPYRSEKLLINQVDWIFLRPSIWISLLFCSTFWKYVHQTLIYFLSRKKLKFWKSGWTCQIETPIDLSMLQFHLGILIHQPRLKLSLIQVLTIVSSFVIEKHSFDYFCLGFINPRYWNRCGWFFGSTDASSLFWRRFRTIGYHNSE